MSSEPSELSLELVRREADACVLAVSSELSLCSAGLVTLWGSRLGYRWLTCGFMRRARTR
jgi:hypothetical protein